MDGGIRHQEINPGLGDGRKGKSWEGTVKNYVALSTNGKGVLIFSWAKGTKIGEAGRRLQDRL